MLIIIVKTITTTIYFVKYDQIYKTKRKMYKQFVYFFS